MKFILEKFSYRFAVQVLNSRLAVKEEVERILLDPSIKISGLSRPQFNSILYKSLRKFGWDIQPPVFDEPGDPSVKMDFLKQRVGVEVEFGHSSFTGIDLLKFQVASYSGLDKIDVGIFIVTTKFFQKAMKETHGQNWDGSLTFEKVIR